MENDYHERLTAIVSKYTPEESVKIWRLCGDCKKTWDAVEKKIGEKVPPPPYLPGNEGNMLCKDCVEVYEKNKSSM